MKNETEAKIEAISNKIDKVFEWTETILDRIYAMEDALERNGVPSESKNNDFRLNRNESYDDDHVLFSIGNLDDLEPAFHMTFSRNAGREYFELEGSIAYSDDLDEGYDIYERFDSEREALSFAGDLKEKLESWAKMTDEEKKENKVKNFPFGQDDIDAVEDLIGEIELWI